MAFCAADGQWRWHSPFGGSAGLEWRPHGLPDWRALRGIALLVLVFLAARPVWMSREPPASATRTVMLLMDRSESMSLEEKDISRYQQALGFLRERLLPALRTASLPVQAMLFDQSAEPADGAKLASATPNGKRTNLGGAVAQALANAAQPPLAVIALTDGIVNESADNTHALTALVDARVPFIGVGFGSDQGVRTLSLREVEAPSIVSTKTAFSIAAQLEMINTEDMPAFDLLLFRDGQMSQKRTVMPGKGSRTWLESFPVTEEKQGVHNYAVQLLPPGLPGLKCVNMLANTAVRISDEKELRVLYIQGALTWDYKFITLALRNDQTIKMTGLTRTSKQSVFRQNVESAGELMNGFPTSLEELAPFRVVVLSNLAPNRPDARAAGSAGALLRGAGGRSADDWRAGDIRQFMAEQPAGAIVAGGFCRQPRACRD